MQTLMKLGTHSNACCNFVVALLMARRAIISNVEFISAISIAILILPINTPFAIHDYLCVVHVGPAKLLFILRG